MIENCAGLWRGKECDIPESLLAERESHENKRILLEGGVGSFADRETEGVRR